MNGIHDMGGMHGMGPIRPEKDEPVFHEPWEGRTFALALAAPAISRYLLEQIPPADYLRMSYYEKWLAAMPERLVQRGRVTREELQTGKPAAASPKGKPALTAEMVPQMAMNGKVPTSVDPNVRPRFKPGQRVRARRINPTGHTRLPRYARGRVGTIERDYGVFPLPDTSGPGAGTERQHVYSVRFAARELWGNQAAAKDSVYIDLWDDYLERV
jgi:nitrile hydratase